MPSSNIKCKSRSLVVANSSILVLDVTTMLELGKCHRKIEGKWSYVSTIYSGTTCATTRPRGKSWMVEGCPHIDPPSTLYHSQLATWVSYGISIIQVNDIVFSLCVFDMWWRKWLWVSMYKRSENGELKCKEFCVYVWEKKSLETLNQRKQRIFIFYLERGETGELKCK